jgi:hypothetical protein
MAGPITWRNVNGPSLAEASRPLAFANANLTQGFDALRNVVGQVENTDKANWDTQKGLNTQELMNRLYAAQTPEDMAAARANIVAGLNQFGGQVDQAAIRGAMDTRPTVLQDRLQKTWAFENAALDQQEAPLVNQARGLIAQGKTAEAAPLIAGLSSRNGAALFASLDQREQETLRRTREGEKWGWERNKAEHDAAIRPFDLQVAQLKPQQIQAGMDNDRAQLAIARGQLGISAANAKMYGETQRMAQEAAINAQMEKQLGDVVDKMGAIANQRIGTAKGTEALFKAIRDNVKDPQQVEALVRNAGRVLSDPKNGSLNVAEAMTAILSTKDDRTWFGRWRDWRSDQGEDLPDLFARARNTPEFQARAEVDAAREAILAEQIQTLRSALKRPVANEFKNADGTSKNPEDSFTKNLILVPR